MGQSPSQLNAIDSQRNLADAQLDAAATINNDLAKATRDQAGNRVAALIEAQKLADTRAKEQQTLIYNTQQAKIELAQMEAKALQTENNEKTARAQANIQNIAYNQSIAEQKYKIELAQLITDAKIKATQVAADEKKITEENELAQARVKVIQQAPGYDPNNQFDVSLLNLTARYMIAEDKIKNAENQIKTNTNRAEAKIDLANLQVSKDSLYNQINDVQKLKAANMSANERKIASMQASANAAVRNEANSKAAAANNTVYLAVCVFFIIIFLGYMMMRR